MKRILSCLLAVLMIISVNTGVVFAEGDINVVLEAENFVSSVVTDNGVTEGATKAEDGVMKISTKADYAAFGMDFEVMVGGWYVMEWINTPENATYSKTELALNGDKLISNENQCDTDPCNSCKNTNWNSDTSNCKGFK